jgi:hypothetical protein
MATEKTITVKLTKQELNDAAYSALARCNGWRDTAQKETGLDKEISEAIANQYCALWSKLIDIYNETA